MSTPSPSENPTVPAAEVNVTPGLEEKLNEFWTRHRRNLAFAAGLVVGIIVWRGASDYLSAQNEQALGAEYAKATTPAQRQAFAQANAGHELAGVAWLQVADAAYADGRSADAIAAYQSAGKDLAAGPLADRAALGLAMSRLQSGNAAEAEAGLKALTDSSTVAIGIRTEAAYHLAARAHAAGDDATFRSLATQIMQVDPASPWSQRLMTLQVAKATPAPAATASTAAPVSAPAEDSSAGIKFNLGK